MKKYICIFLASLTLLSGCGTMSKTAEGTLVGSGAGAIVGATVGTIIGKDAKGAAIGAAIGTAIGAGTGAIIGHKMDQKAEELAKALEEAEVETVEDVNGLEAIKVTFESGILFPLNGITLNDASKEALKKFAGEMKDLPETDLTIFGHTDNTGTAAVNERISAQRADAVASFLQSNGIDVSRITTEGKSFNEPIADNATAEGRAQNRRVEIFISANEKMIQQAEAGELE